MRSRLSLRRLLSILLTAAVAGSAMILGPTVAASAATVTETEPNNTTATANHLAVGDTMTGSTFGSYDDYDIYSFQVAATSRLDVGFTFPSGLGTGTNYYLSIVDSAGATRYSFELGGGDYTGAWASNYAMYLPVGTYYVQVHGYSSYASWGKPYSLTLGLTPGAFEAEPNDSTAHANPLPIGATVTGSTFGSYDDYDIYSVPVPKSTHIKVSLGRSPGLGSATAYGVSLIDAFGTSLGSWTVGGDGTGAPTSVKVSAGTYYVQVHGYSGYSSWGKPYALKVGYAFTTKTPKITGSAKVGHKLTAHVAKWGPGKVALKYQWLRGQTPIAHATGKTYKLTAKDRSRHISVRVSAAKVNYISAQKTSSSTRKVTRKN